MESQFQSLPRIELDVIGSINLHRTKSARKDRRTPQASPIRLRLCSRQRLGLRLSFCRFSFALHRCPALLNHSRPDEFAFGDNTLRTRS